MTTLERQQEVESRSSGLNARQYRVMGWFLILLALIAGTVIVVDFWKRLGSAAPLLAMACVMDMVAGSILIYLGKRKAKAERNG